MHAFYVKAVALFLDQIVDEFCWAENFMYDDVAKEADVCSPLSNLQ